MNIEGTFFDVEYMLRLAEARRVGLWHWQDWETALLYRDWPILSQGGKANEEHIANR
jgi:hypothetical protein